MSIRTRLAKAIAGKSAILTKDDFGGDEGWQSLIEMVGGKKSTGEIRWNDYATQRNQYTGTTYACSQKIEKGVATASLHLYVPAGRAGNGRRIAVSDETKGFLMTRPHCKAIMQNQDEVEEILEHPALDLFNRAGSAMNRFQLMSKTMMYMVLNGNCYWRPMMNQTKYFPVEISFINPEKIHPFKQGGRVAGYEYGRKEDKDYKKYKLDEIVHFWYPNPYSDTEGYSPVSAASQRISGEQLIATIQNSTLTNMGIPPAVVKILRQMPDDKFQEFKKAFKNLYGKLEDRGKIGFTQGEWELEVIGQTLQEIGYIEGANMLREMIANVLQVPISKLTMESSNRAVAEAGNTEFMRDTILPNLTMIAEELTESLSPMFPSLVDSGAFWMFDNPVPFIKPLSSYVAIIRCFSRGFRIRCTRILGLS